jgi:hypothetical protein
MERLHVNVKITFKKTGESVVVSSIFGEYWWTEGNGSCDCNRRIDFFRAKGLELRTGCGPCSEGLFAVEFVQ